MWGSFLGLCLAFALQLCVYNKYYFFNISASTGTCPFVYPYVGTCMVHAHASNMTSCSGYDVIPCNRWLRSDDSMTVVIFMDIIYCTFYIANSTQLCEII